jgi:hypothetical protein
MAGGSFDPSSPGAVRLAEAHLRARAQRAPTEILLDEDVLDLDGQRTLDAGNRVTVDAGLAEALIARGAARRVD